jgi:23S rRNA (cytidine1920-2'-O)/16S rRNA (cytidine1409-2'-O)-methyltransferase
VSAGRIRIDRLLVERGLAPSRTRAERLVMAGGVLVADRPVVKPGTLVAADAEVRVRGGTSPYVSRGGEKLAGALDAFEVDVRGRVALDVGASTGGFTHCLLERGAARVVAVDVGYGQLAWSLRQDPRVRLLERTNARGLRPEQLPETPTLATVDVSFISLRLVLPAVVGVLAPGADVVALVKPQFEVGRGRVGKGGVVRDPALRAEAVADVRAATGALGLTVRGEAESVLPGPRGNREVFLWLAAPGARA